MVENEPMTTGEMDARVIAFLRAGYPFHSCKITALVLAVYRESFPINQLTDRKIRVYKCLCSLEKKKIVKNLIPFSIADTSQLIEMSQWVLMENI